MTRQLDLTVQGVVGTHPVLSRVGSRQRAYCRFRVAVTPTYRTDRGWQNGDTMWFTAKAWGQLAENISRSLHKGDPVLLTGRLGEETWESDKGLRSSNVIVLQAAGHDLTRGETRFMRVRPSEAAAAEDGEAAGPGDRTAAPGSAATPGSAPSATTPGEGAAAGTAEYTAEYAVEDAVEDAVEGTAGRVPLPEDYWETGGPADPAPSGQGLPGAGPQWGGALPSEQLGDPAPPGLLDDAPSPAGAGPARPPRRSADYEVVGEAAELVH